MVISDVNRYVFIEVPQTASSALAAELIANYDGRRILRKHTDYAEFLRSASKVERTYQVLATIRNPLDIVVSKFAKARDDHLSRFGVKQQEGTPWGNRFRPEAREYDFIAKHGQDFGKYLLKFYPRIYNSRACLLPSHAHILRYEALNEGLAEWLSSIGVTMVRPLPWRHTTEGRDRSFAGSYDVSLRKHAVRVFGPYMKHWGYEFPLDWAERDAPQASRLLFEWDCAWRRFYFRHVHYGWIMPRARRRHSVVDED